MADLPVTINKKAETRLASAVAATGEDSRTPAAALIRVPIDGRRHRDAQLFKRPKSTRKGEKRLADGRGGSCYEQEDGERKRGASVLKCCALVMQPEWPDLNGPPSRPVGAQTTI